MQSPTVVETVHHLPCANCLNQVQAGFSLLFLCLRVKVYELETGLLSLRQPSATKLSSRPLCFGESIPLVFAMSGSLTLCFFARLIFQFGKHRQSGHPQLILGVPSSRQIRPEFPRVSA